MVPTPIPDNRSNQMSAMADHYDAQLQGVAAVIKAILTREAKTLYSDVPVETIIDGLWPIAMDYAMTDGEKYAVLRAAIVYLEAARRA